MENKASSLVDEKTRVLGAMPGHQIRTTPPPAVPPPPGLQKAPFAGAFPGENKTTKKTLIAGAIGLSVLGGAIALMASSDKGGEMLPGLPAAAGGTIGAAPDQKVVLSTGHEVYEKNNDDLTYEEALQDAKEHIGSDGFFEYKGHTYSTTTNEEWLQKTEDEKVAFLDKVNVGHIPGDPVTVQIDGEEKQLTVDLPMLHTDHELLIAHDDDNHVFLLDKTTGENTALPNMSVNEFGSLERTDPVTGEVSTVNPTMIMQEINDGGAVDIKVEIPDIIGYAYEATFLSQWIDTDGDGIGDQQIFGWDTDGDGAMDVVDDGDGVYNDLFDTTTVTDYSKYLNPEEVVVGTLADDTPSLHDMAMDKAHQLAEDAGMDDIKKIKIHESGDGVDIKVKDEDGEKIKVHMSREELLADHASHHSEPVVEGIAQPGDTQEGVVNGEVLDTQPLVAPQVDDASPDTQASGDDISLFAQDDTADPDTHNYGI